MPFNITYSADHHEIIELSSLHHSSTIKILKDIGNTLISFQHDKREMMFFPYTPEEYLKNDRLGGNPFMYPFANRIKPAVLTPNAPEINKNEPFVKLDGNGMIMHGFTLKSTDWKTYAIEEDDEKITHHAELQWNEQLPYFKYFPIEHKIILSHILTEGCVEIVVQIENTAQQNLPLSFGFHPYFQIDRADESDIFLQLPVQKEYAMDELLIPNGNQNTISEFVPNEWFSISNKNIDTGYTDFMSNPDGETTFKLRNKTTELSLIFDNSYQNTIVYIPTDKSKPYLCIEPMVLPTNGLNTETNLPIVLPNQIHTSSFKMQVS